MLKVSSKKRVTSIGNSFYVIVGKDYIDNGQIDTDKNYDVYLEESTDESTNTS